MSGGHELLARLHGTGARNDRDATGTDLDRANDDDSVVGAMFAPHPATPRHRRNNPFDSR